MEIVFLLIAGSAGLFLVLGGLEWLASRFLPDEWWD